MKINFVPMRPLGGLSSRVGGTPGHAPHGAAIAGEFMRPIAQVPRPPAVEQRSWETLAIHVDEAQRGGAIASAALRTAVDTVVRELRVGCVTWEDIYVTLDAAVLQGPVRPVAHPLEMEVHASRSAAIVAHMHSWADVQRLAEIEDPCVDG